MRILVVSNFYPPHYNGGYELGCRDMADALRARGHNITVLTSTYPVNRASQQGHILRWLETNYTWTTEQGILYAARKLRQEVRCRRSLDAAVRRTRPELIYIWGMCFIPVSLLYAAQATGLPVCYFVSDDWLKQFPVEQFDGASAASFTGQRAIYQRGKQWLYALMRGNRPAAPLDLSHVQFAAQYLKQAALEAGRALHNPEVIHWGVDPSLFSYRWEARPARKLLFVGQVQGHKGVHTAIEALAAVRAAPAGREATLSIVGTGKEPAYIDSLHALAQTLGVSDAVEFLGKLPRESLPSIYQEHDILLFPSVWPEPFGITPLEAMSSGLAVVGTGTGGSREQLRDEENALLFSAEDAAECAAQVLRLMENPALLEQLRSAGRSSVERFYTFPQMADAIEASLLRAL